MVVDVSPLSMDDGLVAGAFLLAEDSLSLVVLHQVDVVQTLVLAEVKSVLLVHNLDLVGDAVSADLLGVEQIDHSALSGNVELPVTVELLSQAVHWLVSLNDGVGEWVEIAHETSHS